LLSMAEILPPAVALPPGLAPPPAPAPPPSECGEEVPCEKKMKALMESGDSAGALTVLESTSTLNVRMINMAFTAMLATGQSVEAAAVHAMQLCTSKGFTKTTSLHNNILAAFSHQGPPEAVISWLARMRDSGLEIDRQAYNIKLKAHLAMGDLNAAVKLLGCMMRNSPGGPPPPDAVSFNTVLTALAQASQPSKAEKVLTTMLDSGLEADTRSFTGVIVAFARASQPGPAAKWLERMLQAGVQPDTTTWNAVLLAYANAGDCEGAFRLLGNFESHAKDECPNAKPDVRSFNSLLSACAKAGQPARAEDAFFQMEKRGITPDVVSFTTLISAHARAGSPAQAQSWLTAMIARGNQPDAVAYNAVCSAHARVGDAVAAMECLQSMRAAAVTASATTHSILVNALVQAGQADAAETMLREVISASGPLDASSFNSLLHHYAKQSQPARAMSIISLMQHARVSPSLVTFNSLASAYAAHGDLEATEDALKQATDHGFTLDRYSYGALLQVSGGVGRGSSAKPSASKREAAKRHVEAMLRSGVVLNDFLSASACRALGEREFVAMRDKIASERKRSTRSSMQSEDSARQQPSVTATSASVDMQEAEEEEAGHAAVDEDGWQTVPSKQSRSTKQRNTGGGRRSVPEDSPRGNGRRGVISTKSPIAKERPPRTFPPGATTNAPAMARRVTKEDVSAVLPTDVRLAGVPLTRSKSERARLLLLAQEVTSAELSRGSSNPASVTSTQGGYVPPHLRNKANPAEIAAASMLGADCNLGVGVPLKRSAASELAITLGADMKL